ncbi:MAG TPA: hypothetical protein VK809_05985 [Bacteroidia bacterium]|jgi:hypothetical protein|nr:hypothetical protein [Bacteroidia bacterium]
MFNDKKLRNTFWLEIFVILSLVCFWSFGARVNAGVIAYAGMAISLVALVVSIYLLVKYIRKWKIKLKQIIETVVILTLAGMILFVVYHTVPLGFNV